MDFWDILASPAWGALESLGAAAAVGVAAWAARLANGTAAKMTGIEKERRHNELCPRLRVICEPFGTGVDIVRLRVMLIGPPGLDRIDRLTATIRNDHFRRGKGELRMGGPTEEELKRQIWGPYRFTAAPDDARPDATGRTVVYSTSLPLGEELPYQLEHTLPGHWMTSMSQADWLRQRGKVLRIAFTAEHSEYGRWYLPCEIDTTTMPVTVYVPQHGENPPGATQ